MRLSVICASRIWVFPIHIESFQLDRLDPSQRTITIGIDTAACETVVPANYLAARGYLVHKDSHLDMGAALQAETKCMTTERGSCAP